MASLEVELQRRRPFYICRDGQRRLCRLLRFVQQRLQSAGGEFVGVARLTDKNVTIGPAGIFEPFEWIPPKDFTPPLVSQEIYEAVQKRLEVQQARTVDGHRRYLLTGFGRCPICGTKIVGTSLRRGYSCYRCRGTWKTATRDTICAERYIPAEHLERVIWTTVVETIRDPAVLVADLQEHLSTGDGGLGAKMDELRREIADLKSQQRRLMELRQKDLIDLEILETQIGPVKALCDEKEEELLLLEAQHQQHDSAEEAGRRVAEYCQVVSDKLDDLDLEGKRAALAAFGVKFEATRENLSITIKMDPNCTTIARTLASGLAESRLSPRS